MEPIDQIGQRAGRRALADAAAYVDVEQGLDLVKSGAATVRPEPQARRSPARLAVAAAAALFVLATTGTAIVVLQNTTDTGTDQPPADNPPPIPPNTDTGEDPSDPSDTSSPTTPTSAPTTVPPTSSRALTTTSPTPSGTSPTPHTTMAAASDVPQGLQDWPPRSTDPVGIEDVPAFLPTQPVPNATTVSRYEETGDGSGRYDYTQTWYNTERDSHLTVTTNIDQMPTTQEQFQDPVDTSDWKTEWETAFFVRTAPGYTHLRLAGPGGFVELSAPRLDRTEVLEIARTMQRRPAPAAGWDLRALPAGWRGFDESGGAPRASRELRWRDDDGSLLAELTVATEYAEAVTVGWTQDAVVDTIDLGDATAVVTESSGRVAISWPLDNADALFGFAGNRQTAISIVRSLEIVDDAIWRNATEPRDPQADGCQSLFC